MDFNEKKETYRQIVENSVAFAGQDLDFYTRVKADAIGRVLSQHGFNQPKLLDVGCGHGFIHPLLTGLGCKVVGVETASEVLPLAKHANPDIEYIAYDGRTLPFAARSFDIVLAICVMHHVPPRQWQEFLREACRVLRPGGRVIIFEHNPLNPLTRLVVSRNVIDADATLLHHRDLAAMLKSSGFDQVQSRFILFTPFSQPIVRRAERFLEKVPLGAQYFITGSA